MKKLGPPLLGLLAITVSVSLPGRGEATWPLQRAAKELDYPAEDCAFCHTFSLEHMTERAREVGIASTNCYTCHGRKLPLSGYDLYGPRGRFLLDEKARREAKSVDVSWLADYEEGEEDPSP